ncbi:MAG: YbaN family protein [Bacteroidales bacterium]|nr:YbaN family protein [Bacteroidales bacterium]
MNRDYQYKKWTRWLIYASGFFFLILGILGIFIPLLPTTPFLLLAAWAFMHTNRKIYLWMFKNRWFGKSFSNYMKNRSVSRSVKISSLIILSITMAYSIIFVIEFRWLKVLLLVIYLAVAYHIIKLKTIDDKIQKL